MKLNQKGQILLEGLAVGVFYWLIFFVSSIFVLFIWAQIWVGHWLYETLICLNTPTPAYKCKQIFNAKSKLGLILFKTKGLKWNINKNKIQVQVIGAFNFKKQLAKNLNTMDSL